MLDAPLLVLVDLETTEAAPTGPSLELLTAARELTSGDVVALALQPLGEAASAALAGADAARETSWDAGAASDSGAVGAAVARAGPTTARIMPMTTSSTRTYTTPRTRRC